MPSKCTGYRPGIPQQPYTKWDTDKDEVEVDYKQLDSKRGSWFSGRKGYVLRVLIIVVVFSLGLILGYVLRRSIHEFILSKTKCPYVGRYEGYSKDLSEELRLYIDPASLEENLRNYTAYPHQAGVHNNNILGQEVLRMQMANLGLKVKTYTYNVLLSYPNFEDENLVTLLNGDGGIEYETNYRGPHPANDPEYAAYMAFAPNGTVEGDIVYANFGQKDDFHELSQRSISCIGNIVIIRYGKNSVQEKLQNAADCGTNAVIFYTDPAQAKGMHTLLDEMYPHNWWLPGWAVRRATTLTYQGDPLTPELPSIEGLYRVPESEAELPTMLVHAVSYDDAQELMTNMKGPKVTSFQGGLPRNVTYNMGPGYNEARNQWKIRMSLHNEREVREITDIIGIITGREEPDRYVIVGCHYDAWLFGGIDPNSGTTILLELIKAFTNLTEKDWKPRRSIIFAHWDAGEQGQQGSYEWAQENEAELRERTVAYINLDAAVTGNFSLSVQSSPPLHQLWLDAAKTVEAVNGLFQKGFEDMYDEWMVNNPNPSDRDFPRISLMSDDSDHAAFLYNLGIPSSWPQYNFDHEGLGFQDYPAYHTAIDNFTYVSNFVDPGFHAHHRLTELVAEVILRLTTHAKLPLDVRMYSHVLGEAFDQLRAMLIPNGHTHCIDYLGWAIGNFTQVTNSFMENLENLNSKDIYGIRHQNDKILRVSQAFIYPKGLPKQPNMRNIVFAPSSYDLKEDAIFPGIQAAFLIASEDPSSENRRELQMQISMVTLAIKSATNIMVDSIIT